MERNHEDQETIVVRGLTASLLSIFLFSFEALKERRLRAALTILMVVIGGSLIVAVSGVSTGTVGYINQQFALLSGNVLVVTPRTQNFVMDEVKFHDFEELSHVQAVIPFIQQPSHISSRGKSQSVVAIGVDQSKLTLLFPTMTLAAGSYVSKYDGIGIILGNRVVYAREGAAAFAEVGQTVELSYAFTQGDKTTLQRKAFVVRGTLEYIGSGFFPIDQMVFISLRSSDSFFRRSGEYDGFYMVAESIDYNADVLRQISNRFGEDVNVLSPKTIADTISRISNSIAFFVDSVAAISLLVASVGIVTTLQTSVMERTREIGLLKALGFSRQLILLLFLSEAIIIGVTGGTISLGVGVGLAWVMKTALTIGSTPGFLVIVPEFSSVIFLSAWLLCFLLSIIAGIYPAWRASRLDPVVALRHE